MPGTSYARMGSRISPDIYLNAWNEKLILFNKFHEGVQKVSVIELKRWKLWKQSIRLGKNVRPR